MNKIKEQVNKWREILCSWSRRNDAVKMLILKKATYKFNANPNKIPMVFLTEQEKTCLQFVWNPERCRIAKKDLRTSYKVEGITLPDFKLYYKSIAIKSL